MSRIFEIMEHRNDRDVCLHRVTVPSIHERGGYRATLSVEAFGEYWLARRFPYCKETGKTLKPIGNTKNRWFSVVLIRRASDRFDLYDNPEIKDHDSIWDFYKSIQWDYKKKRFDK